jgi:hypothetical protein
MFCSFIFPWTLNCISASHLRMSSHENTQLSFQVVHCWKSFPFCRPYKSMLSQTHYNIPYESSIPSKMRLGVLMIEEKQLGPRHEGILWKVMGDDPLRHWFAKTWTLKPLSRVSRSVNSNAKFSAPPISPYLLMTTATFMIKNLIHRKMTSIYYPFRLL